ncbi:MAG: carboxypeptidase regulatory-like domain-containing protein [Bacteroidota bacterium]
MKQIVLLFIVLCSGIGGCATTQISSQPPGVKGKVLWVEGNQMPGPDRKINEGSPVVREIIFYDVLKTSDLKRQNALFQEPPFEPVAIVKTNEQGEFEVNLPAGRYSLFTRENNGLFANLFDGENNVNPVTVESGEVTEVTVVINYKAVY